MFSRTISVGFCAFCTLMLFFSFQNSTDKAEVNTLKEKAQEFEINLLYDSAAYYFEKARALSKKIKTNNALQSVLEAEITFWINRGDKDIDEINKQLDLFWNNHRSDAKFRINYFEAKSILFLNNSERDSFEYFFNETVKELKSQKDFKYEISYYSYVAQQHLFKDDLLGAKKYVELAENCIKLYKPKPNEIDDYYSMASDFYIQYGDCEKALKVTLTSYENSKKLKPEDEVGLSYILNNLGVIYACLEDIENAEKYYDEGLKLVKRNNQNTDISICYNNIGLFKLKYYPDIRLAIEPFHASLKYSTGDSQTDNQSKISSFQGLAAVYIKLNNSDSANFYCDKLLELQKKSNYREASTFDRLAKLSVNEKNLNKAAYYFQKALEIFRNKFGEKHSETSRAKCHLANVYKDQKNYFRAAQLLQEAISANTTEYLDSLNIRKNPDITKVIDRDLMLYQLNTKVALLDSMRLKSISGIKTHDVYNAALSSVDLMLYINQNLNITSSKTFWLNKEVQQIFEQAIYYAVFVAKEEQNDKYKEEAFMLSEKSRSILLFESLREKSAARFAGIPDSLTEKENSLRRILINIEKKRNNAQIEKDSLLVSAYERELLEIQMKIENLYSILKQKYPAYYQLKYPALKIKPIDIMSKLGDSTVMLEYFQGKQRSFVFVLRNNSFDCHQIVADSTFTNRVLDFQKLVSDLPYAVKSPDEYFGKYSITALQLYNFWLKPYLSPKDKGKRLVIISDGSLSYMPFDALLTQNPETKQANYSNLPYLLRSYTVNYDYSAQLWLQHQQPKPQLNGKILAMAPTYLKKSEDTLALRNRMRSGKERDLRNGITELPGAEKEIKLLKNNYKGFYPTKINASERVWKKNAADYGIVHFAMHGLIDENEPEFSSLVFAEDGDAQEDNFLYAYEIKQSKLNASLVVLSACETGVGKYQRGEGVMSIGRGFMYAGVPSVVMTLWKLNDQSAAELIGNFYKNLANGMQKDKALQQAKLQYLEASNNNTAHPALWGCLMQLGDYSAIKIEKVNYFNYLIISLVLGSVLALLIFFYRRMLTQQKSRPN